MLISKMIRQGLSPFSLVFSGLRYKLIGKDIRYCQKTDIIHPENIETIGSLRVGTGDNHHLIKEKRTSIFSAGKLVITGRVSISRGASFEVKKNATVKLNSCSLGASTFMIFHKLTIGARTLVSWDCLFIDNSIHHIIEDGLISKKNEGIDIGANCWIGARCTFLPNSSIADGTVVATGSIVTKVFTEENILIGGNPAKVLKRGISWTHDSRIPNSNSD